MWVLELGLEVNIPATLTDKCEHDLVSGFHDVNVVSAQPSPSRACWDRWPDNNFVFLGGVIS